jgi:hypothetical protein
MTELHKNEALIVQVVMTPIGDILQPEVEPAFWVVVRVAASGHPIRAKYLLGRIGIAYRALQLFSMRRLIPQFLPRINHRSAPTVRWGGALSADSLPVVCGFPINAGLVPGLTLGRGKQLPPDPSIPSVGRVIGRSTFLGAERLLALSPEDRLKHLYLVGPTGSGKSTAMENLIVDDMKDGHGVAVFDPQGDLIKYVLDCVPPHRQKDVVLFDVSDTARPVGFNILAGENPYAITGQVLTVFDKLFHLSEGTPRALDVLRSTLLTLALQGHTLCEVPIILDSEPRGQAFRARAVAQLKNDELINFWRWFDSLRPREQVETATPINRRLRPLLLYPELKNSLGQRASGFDMHQVLSQQKILLVPLNRGHLGDELSSMVGSLLVAKLWSAVQGRSAEVRRPFYAYIDEFQDLLNLPVSLGEMFAQARGYKLGMTIAQQHTGQLSVGMRRDVFANVRSKQAFQVQYDDARLLSAEFGPSVDEHDFMQLGSYETLARLAVNNTVTAPVTAITLPPPTPLGSTEAVRAFSRDQYGRDLAEVESELATRHRASPAPTQTLAETPGFLVGWEGWKEEGEA